MNRLNTNIKQFREKTFFSSSYLKSRITFQKSSIRVVNVFPKLCAHRNKFENDVHLYTRSKTLNYISKDCREYVKAFTKVFLVIYKVEIEWVNTTDRKLFQFR